MLSLAAILGRIACLSSQEARRAMVWREKGRSGEAQECERFAESLAEILADVSEPRQLPLQNRDAIVREVPGEP